MKFAAIQETSSPNSLKILRVNSYATEEVGIASMDFLNDFSARELLNHNIEKIDFTVLKTNLEQYTQFVAELQNSYNYHSDPYHNNFNNSIVSTLRRDLFQELNNLETLSTVRPDIFSKNIQAYLKLGYALKDVFRYKKEAKEFFFNEHSDKYYKRLEYIDNFNKEEYDKDITY